MNDNVGELSQIFQAFGELAQTVEQMPIADLVLLGQAIENTTTFAEVAPEYLRLKVTTLQSPEPWFRAEE